MSQCIVTCHVDAASFCVVHSDFELVIWFGQANRAQILQLSMFCSGLAMMALAAFNSPDRIYPYLLVFSVIYGAFGGAFMALLPVRSQRLWSLRRLSKV
jgi:hypothetical protein